MQRLGLNIKGYSGQTIDIRRTLEEIERAAREHGWSSETFHELENFRLVGLRREPRRAPDGRRPRIYLSSGIHGDEPAGPLAVLELLRADRWPANAELWLCPCLNPVGFTLNKRENQQGLDLNRDYLNPSAPEVAAHLAWLTRQPDFDLCLLLHEDWESHGFYLYEQNPDGRPSLAEPMVRSVAELCPVDVSPTIEGRPANNGIIRPNLDPRTRPQWPEAFFLIMRKTRLSYTLEAPSDFPLPARVAALAAAVQTAVGLISTESPCPRAGRRP
jgi:hypothetical protein